MLNCPLVWRQHKIIPWLYPITGCLFLLSCHSSPALQMCYSTYLWMSFWLWLLICSQRKRNCFGRRWGGERLEGSWAAVWGQVRVVDEGVGNGKVSNFCHCRKPSSSDRSCQCSVLQRKRRKACRTKCGNSMLWHHSHISPWKLFLPWVSASLHPEPTQLFVLSDGPSPITSSLSNCSRCPGNWDLFLAICSFPCAVLSLLPMSRLSGGRGALNTCKDPACWAINMLPLSGSWL